MKDENKLNINDNKIICLSERNPENICWSNYDIEYVIGNWCIYNKKRSFTNLKLSPNIRILISAPSKDCPMYVMGVNNKEYKGEQSGCNLYYKLCWTNSKSFT